MQTLRQDLAYALRQMRLSPLFTLTALLTLALGIGATTAIFSLIDSVMLKSLPVVDPSSLYRVGDGSDCCIEGGPQDNWGMFSYTFYQRLKATSPEFSELATFQAGSSQFSVRRGETDRVARPLRGEFISGNYFATFGIGAFTGRVLSPSDDHAAAPPVAMLSYRAWQQQYGSDPSVVGSAFIIDNHPVTIIGIVPPGFQGETVRTDPPDIFVPVEQEPLFRGSNSINGHFQAWLRIIGRLKPGVKTAPLADRYTAMLRQWMLHDSDMPAEWMAGIQTGISKQVIHIIPGGAGVGVMRENYASSLRILMTVCGLVLLIACANIANLLLARGTARRAQTSVRLALGASRKRLIRQTLTESVLLSVFGGLAGVAVAYGGVRLIVALVFHDAHVVPISATPSLLVLGFAFTLSLFTGILFGVAPALVASHADPAEALRGANRSTRDSSSASQKVLVIAQAALSIVLLAGAGLLTRSLANLQHQDFGYQTDHRVTISLSAPWASYTPARIDAMYRELQDQLSHLPGVRRAAIAQYTPLTDNWGEMVIREGHPMPNMSDDVGSSWDHVAPGYLETLGQHILRGRSLSEDDTASTEKVAVVDEAFVHRFFKQGEDPIGQRFGLDLPKYGGTFKIVGVVAHATYRDPASTEPPSPMFFVPLDQRIHYDNATMQSIDDETHFIEGAVLEMRGSSDGLEAEVRRVLAQIDPNLTLLGVRSLEDQVNSNFDQQRVVARMTGLFGILALVLAAVGLYGVTAYTVARRTGEIGVRMALGADRANITRLVLRGAFTHILIGLVIGIPIAIGCSRLIAAQLFHVQGWDPLVLGGSVLALGLCALLASILPARKAASIDPVRALRTE